MKALFYKFSTNLPLVILIMLYFWVLMPIAFWVESLDLYTSPVPFIMAGIIYVFERGDDERSKFGQYMNCLPIKRSTYVSYMFILTVISEIMIFLFMIVLGLISPKIFDEMLLMSTTPLLLFSSMFISLAIVGLALFLNFRFSFSKSWIIFLLFYAVTAFITGFITGFTEDNEVLNNMFNSAVFRLSVAVISGIIFAVEWWLSVKVYNKKDL